MPLSGVERLIQDAMPQVSEAALADALVRRAEEQAALLSERGMMARENPIDPRARIPGGSSVDMPPAEVRPMFRRSMDRPVAPRVETLYTPPPPKQLLAQRIAANPTAAPQMTAQDILRFALGMKR
jgi:hypothetical protein